MIPTITCNDGYDIDTSIDTIYANAAQSRQVMAPTDKYCQLLQEGHKQWECYWMLITVLCSKPTQHLPSWTVKPVPGVVFVNQEPDAHKTADAR